jgi:hypothetical protein
MLSNDCQTFRIMDDDPAILNKSVFWMILRCFTYTRDQLLIYGGNPTNDTFYK